MYLILELGKIEEIVKIKETQKATWNMNFGMLLGSCAERKYQQVSVSISEVTGPDAIYIICLLTEKFSAGGMQHPFRHDNGFNLQMISTRCRRILNDLVGSPNDPMYIETFPFDMKRIGMPCPNSCKSMLKNSQKAIKTKGGKREKNK